MFSDEVMPSVEFARYDFGHRIIAISVRLPASELLKNMAEGSATRLTFLFIQLENSISNL